ncbi:exoribonuclease II [Anaerobiospirillum sp. NML120449]|uniref:exoribonuclease II n=1 Tax=Anaerobiospirillum sp. NML120449 TaxID=2932817 RepID=UPI00248B7A80|nr:exoribonuclease II [Anaerobiospirillum sp. NML120449]
MLFDDPALMALKQGFNAEKVKKEGIVKGTDRGFGFLEVPGEKESYFIAPQFMKNVINGDRVNAIITTDEERGKSQAEPETLIECALKDHFVGRVTFVNNKLNIIPDVPSIKQSFIADDQRQDKSVKLTEGDWVMGTLKKHALNDKFFRAAITEIITSKDDPTTPWVVSLKSLDLPDASPVSTEEFKFHEQDLPRENLTDIPFVTIDSEKTEDMDDALYIEKTDDGFKLYVAIADPTGYIDENSEMDKEASRRAFSIYLPGRNIPMLPRELADNLCSLREGEQRPALVGIIHVLSDGTIATDDTQFKLAMIKSHGKLVYNYVSDYIENGDTSNFNPDETIKKVLSDLVELTHVRDNYRTNELAAFRTRPDYEFILTEEGALDRIEINFRRIANQIVEECMIAANVACGNFLAQHLNTGIFNTHTGFVEEELADVVELLAANGFNTTEEALRDIPGFSAARRYANSLEKTYLDNMMRKHQEYSQMMINPGPHYALGVQNYATWTSPIRKYGDMINHRLIKSVICENEHPRMPDEDTLMVMNQARRTNRMAERSVRDWLYADYLYPDMENRTVFDAEVFDVVRGGLRVILMANGAFIFVPGSFIISKRDVVDFDTVNGQVTYMGEVAFRLGDPIKVRIVSIEKITRSIVGAPAELPLGMPVPDADKVMENRREKQNQRR